MKIKVPLEIEVDPKKWEDGAVAPENLSDDVQSYIIHSVRRLALIAESGAEVAWLK
jgi:hypothetical protein